MVATHKKSQTVTAIAVCLIGVGLTVWAVGALGPTDVPTASIKTEQGFAGMQMIAAGRYRRGSDSSLQLAARPAHDVSLRAFLVDEHPVTNRQFKEFVTATDYLTTAEQQSWGNVFDKENGRWVEVKDANWRQPSGPNAGQIAHDRLPVVQVSWHDAVAFARWAGKRLPTEAEWECVARSGNIDTQFPWGTKELKYNRYQANYWQGPYSENDSGDDGYIRLAPVMSYQYNAFKVYGMAGNLWQWCSDWYADDYYQQRISSNPPGPITGSQRVVRGGSWLDSLQALKVHHREHRRPNESYSNVGFRCVKDLK